MTTSRSLRTVLLLILVGILLAPEILPPLVSGQLEELDPVSSPDLATGSATLAYWTPERMRSAQPYPMPTVQASGKVVGKAATRMITGAAVPGSGPGETAEAGPTTVGTVAEPSLTNLYAYPFPFTRTGLPTNGPDTFYLYTKYPWSTNGKLFFTQGTSRFVCSGTAVTPNGFGLPTKKRNLVVTAGHCINTGRNGQVDGNWSENVLFCPAYHDELKPFGCWAGIRLWTTRAWFLLGALSGFRRDVGMIIVERDGASLGNVAGDEGIAFGFSNVQQYVDFGYPAAAPFNGLRVIVCMASTAEIDARPAGPGPDPRGIGCDMTAGADGGGWVMQFTFGGGGYVHGVNSYKYRSQPLAIYSPYFDWSGDPNNLCRVRASISCLWLFARNSIP